MPDPIIETLPALIKRGEYAGRFQSLLKERADQFVSSIIQVGATMPEVEPRSIIAAGMMAATLDLPVNKSLGWAWIVPYRHNGRSYAQFQVGFRGYIQLALRSGAYKAMNARAINAEVMSGFSELGDPIFNWERYDPSKPVAAYFFGWALANGFVHAVAWTEAEVRKHAERYSQAYRAKAEIWQKNFEEMAVKTVITNELRKWGILSIQMQRALFADQMAAPDVGAPAITDGADAAGLVTGAEPGISSPALPTEEKLSSAPPFDGSGMPKASPPEDEEKLAEMALAPAVAAQARLKARQQAEKPETTLLLTPTAKLSDLVIKAGFSFDDFARLGKESGWGDVNWDNVQSFDDVPEEIAILCTKARTMVLKQLAALTGRAAK